MMFIKYAILMLIFLGSCAIGVIISRKYKNRVNDLRDFKNAINILQTKIKFTYEPLGDIFNEIANIMGEKKKVSYIFKNAVDNLKYEDIKTSWEKAIEDSKEYLSFSKEDVEIIKSLGNMLRKNRCRGSIKRNKFNIKFS